MAQQASGQGWAVEVTDQPLDIAKYTGLVTDPAAGAISSFIGTTRNNFQGKAVLRLEYEAYVPMAVAKLKVSCGCSLAGSILAGILTGNSVSHCAGCRLNT